MEDFFDNYKCFETIINIYIDYLQETPDTNMEDMKYPIILLHDSYRTALEKIPDTTKREWLEELLSEIRQAREDITSRGWIRDHEWHCWDPMECLLNDWTRRVQKIFNDDYSFHWNNNSTRNESFKKFISKELRPLPKKELLKQLESLTLYYLQFLRLKNNFPTRNDRLKKFIFEEVWPLPNIRLLEQMESLTWDYIKHFIQKKGNPTRDDRFINILFEELRFLPSIELPQHLEPLKLAFVKYFILRKWNPDRNDGFNEIIFDETWPLPNMELLQQLKSLTLDYIEYFIQKKLISPRNHRFIKIILEELCSLPNIETSDWLESLKWDYIEYFIQKKWISPRNHRFIKIILEELCSLQNIETSDWLESLKWDYIEYFIQKKLISPRNHRFIKIILEELCSLPNIETSDWLESLKWDYNEESFHLKGEFAAPTWNDSWTNLRLQHLSDIEKLKRQKSILDQYRDCFHWKREEATPTWCDRFTKFDSEELWFLPIIKESKSPQSFYDEESFHPKREKATQTWCDRFTRFLELWFLPDIKELKSTLLFALRHITGFRRGSDDEISHLKIKDAATTWNDRFTKLESPRLFKLLTEKTKEVNKFELLTQKAAFWSEAIIKLLLLSLFLLVDLCGFFTEKTKRRSWSKMSIAFLCLPVILCDDHMLGYHHTGLYYPEEGLYYFETVGYVDDQEIDMYSSESRINIPKSVWMEKHEGNDYWEKQTFMRRGWEKGFRDNLMILASRFNYTRSSHTLQLSYGCALHDNNFTGYYRYGFDGKDFLIFHQDTLLWTPGMQKAEISAQRWNSDSDIGKGVKFYLTEHCKSALKKYIGYGREELEKRVVPEVMVKGQKINGNVRLQCLVYGFHPRLVDVKWVRNGEDHLPSNEMSPILPHPDGTYQIRVSVEVPTKEGDTYSCHVDHSSLEDVLTKKWEPDHAKISYIMIILCALALLLAVSALAFVLKRQGKWKKEPETAGCLLRTGKPHHLDNL